MDSVLRTFSDYENGIYISLEQADSETLHISLDLDVDMQYLEGAKNYFDWLVAGFNKSSAIDLEGKFKLKL